MCVYTWGIHPNSQPWICKVWSASHAIFQPGVCLHFWTLAMRTSYIRLPPLRTWYRELFGNYAEIPACWCSDYLGRRRTRSSCIYKMRYPTTMKANKTGLSALFQITLEICSPAPPLGYTKLPNFCTGHGSPNPRWISKRNKHGCSNLYIMSDLQFINAHLQGSMLCTNRWRLSCSITELWPMCSLY